MKPAEVVGIGKPYRSIFGIELGVREEAGTTAKDSEKRHEENQELPCGFEPVYFGQFRFLTLERGDFFSQKIPNYLSLLIGFDLFLPGAARVVPHSSGMSNGIASSRNKDDSKINNWVADRCPTEWIQQVPRARVAPSRTPMQAGSA